MICRNGHNLHGGRCPECARERHARYRTKHREKRLAESRAWYATNHGKRNRSPEAAAKYYEENKAACLDRTGKYRRKNLAKYAAYRRARRARALNAGGSHTADDIADIRKMQRDRCAYCRSGLFRGGHVDHIQPLARGGGNGRQNLQILCETCNIRKNATDPLKFARKIGRLL